MGSLKLRLVVYFVLLALVPLGAAFWGFSAVVERGETQRVDARLESGLRAALTAYQDEVLAAGRRATRLARNDDFHRALTRGDRQALARVLRGVPNAQVVVGRGEVAATADRFAAQRAATVL